MYTTMMPALTVRVDLPLNPAVLSRLVPVSDPDLYADHLEGESTDERAARLAAADDITDDLLAEAANTVVDEVEQGWGA